jgi:hypothetical protein
MDSNILAVAGSAAMGSVVQELIYWYNLRHQLKAQKYSKLIRSLRYWVTVGAMTVGTAVVSLIWYYDQQHVGLRDAFTFGVGLPLLIKQLGMARHGDTRLGEASGQSMDEGPSGYFTMR